MDEKDDNQILKKKSIVPKTAVKGLINGFVSYGILLVFIFLSIVVFTTWVVENNKDTVKIYITYNCSLFNLFFSKGYL